MGPPIMTFVDEGKPPGDLIRLTITGRPSFYIIPDDGREYMDIPMSEMRPYPAFDAMFLLARICKCRVKELVNVHEIEGII